MFTNNWNNYIKGLIAEHQFVYRNLSGQDVSAMTSDFCKYIKGNTTRTDGLMIIVGDGDAPAKVDDFNLNHRINTLTMVSNQHNDVNAQPSYDNHEPVKTITTVYKNLTSEAITVKEIGVLFNYQNGYAYALLSRDVLDNPVTIDPGKSYAFTYTLEV